MTAALELTIAIPTYRRGPVLVDTLQSLLDAVPGAAELLVLDQTPSHDAAVEARLAAWEDDGRIRCLRLRRPSIPEAMNRALVEARNDLVLFVDDDIVPLAGLAAAHAAAHAAVHGRGRVLVAGRILQPWDGAVGEASWAARGFASTEAGEIDHFMGSNFSVDRNAALAIGGFDENFVRVAYNFEREFADRWRSRGGAIVFHPDAALRHLKAPVGGTRVYGEHLTTILPAHAVGAYYYILRSRPRGRRVVEFVRRPFAAVATRHHLRRPWWIPVTLAAELAGMLWALRLAARGPRLCGTRPEGRS